MPPMIATPLDLSDKEHELAQEFELDIRISPVSIPATVFNTQN